MAQVWAQTMARWGTETWPAGEQLKGQPASQTGSFCSAARLGSAPPSLGRAAPGFWSFGLLHVSPATRSATGTSGSSPSMRRAACRPKQGPLAFWWLSPPLSQTTKAPWRRGFLLWRNLALRRRPQPRSFGLELVERENLARHAAFSCSFAFAKSSSTRVQILSPRGSL